MKHSIYFSIVFLLVIVIFSTCAQRGGNSPVGVTGGSEGGYGQSKDYYRDSYYRSSQIEENIYGVWTDGTETLTLTAEGSFEIESIDQASAGTFSKTEETLTLIYKDDLSITYIYQLTKDRLILDMSK